jgi:hypothetical protein
VSFDSEFEKRAQWGAVLNVAKKVVPKVMGAASKVGGGLSSVAKNAAGSLATTGVAAGVGAMAKPKQPVGLLG